MKKIFINEINKLNNKSHVDKQIIKAFLKRIKDDPRLTKEQNELDHLCSFLVPYNKETGSVFIGHHIKADDWIPPGGHIETGETPVDTVYREFGEELGHTLTTERVELFDLTIKDISGNPRHKCQWHYDYWYLVFTPRIDFQYDRGEFYQAGWYTVKEATKKIKLPQYNQIVKKINIIASDAI